MLALTALAGTGCKRTKAPPAGHPASYVLMAPQIQSHPLMVAQHKSEPSHPMFVFCHPRTDQLDDASISAAEAQVAFDLQANNDDRTEMISAAFERPDIPSVHHPLVVQALSDSASAWQMALLRPPRLA
ncbi:hypothetical protein [Xylophilus sp. GOD-11R]|uniref:hypothetical protein n=1 Tax=Xylophilus sp. GOD-11R TaxID=3089814 RepID=UPI00298C8D74|nr:hypothetical protein [Xylophilus sp. GOD-11R]WPB56211.1 hypothetical protein R9X41_19010 [Xylophilus sp. GOD-11R]